MEAHPAGGEVLLGVRSLPPREQRSKAQAKLDILSVKTESMEEEEATTADGGGGIAASESDPVDLSLDGSWHEWQTSSHAKKMKRKRKRIDNGPNSLQRTAIEHRGGGGSNVAAATNPVVVVGPSSSFVGGRTSSTDKLHPHLQPPVAAASIKPREDTFLPAKKKFKVLWDADHSPAPSGDEAEGDQHRPRPGRRSPSAGLSSSESPQPTVAGEDDETQFTSPSLSGSLSFDFGQVVQEWDNIDATDAAGSDPGSQHPAPSKPMKRQPSRVHFNESVEVAVAPGRKLSETREPLKTGEEKGKGIVPLKLGLKPKKKKRAHLADSKPIVAAVPGSITNGCTRLKTAAIFHTKCLKHEVPDDHFEVPKRLALVIECLQSLKQGMPDCIDLYTKPPKADLRWVKTVHDPVYIEKIRMKVPPKNAGPCHATQSTQELQNPRMEIFQDTYMSFASWNAALRAAGAVIQAVDLLFTSNSPYRNAMCAVRPPGHHCGRKGRTGKVKSQGFCLLNNVAIGAKYALLKYDLQRIAVIDFDVHAGNGTEELLCGDESFFFASIHAVGKHFYPGTGYQNSGSNIMNIPMKGSTKPAAFHKKFREIILKLKEFKPELIMLSAGFDGHKNDPIRGDEGKVGMTLAEADYARLSRRLLKVAARHANGRVISVLEGGYDVNPTTNGLQSAFKAHAMALLQFRRPGTVKVESDGEKEKHRPRRRKDVRAALPPQPQPQAQTPLVPPVRKLPQSPGEIVHLVKADDAEEVDVEAAED